MSAGQHNAILVVVARHADHFELPLFVLECYVDRIVNCGVASRSVRCQSPLLVLLCLLLADKLLVLLFECAEFDLYVCCLILTLAVGGDELFLLALELANLCVLVTDDSLERVDVS